MLLFAASIFVSAFLLFLVEPLIARIILPWFGGSAAVWTTCLMFFQLTLLAGYLYAHGLIRYLKPRTQALVHLAVLSASVLALPILPSAAWKPEDGLHPTARIVALLLATIGGPFLLLATTGPLLQAWVARRDPYGSPYRLYALSNAGSLLALLAYPAVIEPSFRVAAQAYGWSAGYALFLVLCGAATVRMARAGGATRPPVAAEAPAPDDSHPRVSDYLLWIGLAFCPSTLLIAVTSHMTQNIAPIPLLWVAPLALYLLSFIITFESGRWYGRKFWFPMFVAAASIMIALLFPDSRNLNVMVVIPVFGVAFFCCAVICHGELYRARPAPRHLTTFYLMVALGGALGGVFVGLVAPVVFNDYLELPVGLLLATLLITLVLPRSEPSLPGPSARYIEFGLTGALAAGLVYLLAWVSPQANARYRLVERNFYGVLRVEDVSETRELQHGSINHGTEFLRAGWHRVPTTYYGRTSGVGIAIQSTPAKRRIGIVGLGAGTLAAYGRAGDMFRFYEINPLVPEIARSQFYYVRECPAHIEVALGDGRLSLEREPPQNFDVLAVDAFSSDSIPVHLLTIEAFQQYFRHLKPEGVLAVHVSNKYLDLPRVVAAAAAALRKPAILIANNANTREGVYTSDWVMLANDPNLFDMPQWIVADRDPLPRPVPRVWTDDYSSLAGILK